MSWNIEKLGNLLAPSGFDRGGMHDYPVLSITMHEGLIDQLVKFKKRIASNDTSNYRIVYANELVVGFPIDEGVLGFQVQYPAALVSPAYNIWKLKRPAECYVPFIHGYLRSNEARSIYSAKMRGAVARRRSMTREDFLDIDIPFPPLDDQKRIATVLDKANALRRQRQESIQLTKKLLQAVFIEMFGDPVTNPMNWPAVKSSELYADKPRLGTMKPARGQGFLVIRVGEIGNEAVTFDKCGRVELLPEEVKRFTLVPGDTLLARAIGSLAQLGKCSYFNGHSETVVADSHVMRLRPDPTRCDPYWFYCLLASPSGRRLIQARGGATAVQFNINGTQASDLDIPLPPRSLQSSFVSIARRLKELTQGQEQSEKQANKLFSSLQQLAFRGELDLSRLTIGDESATITPTTGPVAAQGRYKRPDIFITPPDIEAQMMALEERLEFGPGDSIAWDENYFKYRILSHALQPPFSFTDIWNAVEYDIEFPSYETVKDTVFRYVEDRTLKQQFDETRKEIVFAAHP